MKALCVGLMACFGLFVSAGARAEEPENTPHFPGQNARVSVRTGQPSLHLQIVPRGAEKPIAECERDCEFWASPGIYNVYTYDHATGATRRLKLNVEGSSQYVFHQGDPTARNVGLTMGIAGPAAIITGFLLILPAVIASGCADDPCKEDPAEQRQAAIGLGVLAAGAVATPIGWVLFAHNRDRLLRDDAGAEGSLKPQTEVRVGVVGFPQGGLGLGGTAVF